MDVTATKKEDSKNFYTNYKVMPEPFPPVWASAYGQDKYGFWMAFEYKGVEQRFRWIPPGHFLMGSPETEHKRKDNETQHLVSLTHGYWLADTACTQALWQAVIGKNPSKFQGEDLPVETVSWEEVEAFINSINDKLPSLALRLPSEAEWEYACRADNHLPFSFGENITPDQVNYYGFNSYMGDQQGLYREKTVAVKSLPANAWGLHEMHGNVYEWCQDWYKPEYGSEAVIDPVGPSQGRSRVLRGGSWADGARYARSADRFCNWPENRYSFVGFRLARGQ